MKKPPHIIYAKQPSIQHKDPFQTDKEEKKAGDVMEKAVDKYIKKVVERLNEEMKDDTTA